MFENETWEQTQARKAKIKKEYSGLYEKVSEALFRLDPIGINFKTNDDEYEPEVDTILPRLKECNSVEDVLTVTHEEFQKWFGEDTAGKKENYRKIAEEVWDLWKSFQTQDNKN